MNVVRFALIAALAGAACVATDDPDQATAATAPSVDAGSSSGIAPVVASVDSDVAHAPVESERVDVTDRGQRADDICTLLPADGPCALACDEQALADEYVPVGTCAAFACTLVDGRQFSVHACHAPSP